MVLLGQIAKGMISIVFLSSIVSAAESSVGLVSINTVPSGSGVQEPDFSTDPTHLRLQMASSYTQSAHRFIELGDNTKAIACFTAARGWLRGCEPTSAMFEQCVFSAATAVGSLGELIVGMDRPAACCAGRETLSWVRDRQDLWSMTRNAMTGMAIWRTCPGLHSVTRSEMEHYSSLRCTPLALATNAESIISSFDYTQGELFSNRTDVPYASASHDLKLIPRFRFSPELWDYGHGDNELKEHIEEPTRLYIERRNMSLGFTEMFHSCLPLGSASAGARPARKPVLLCVWRRHVELFSMVSAIFISTLDMHLRESGRPGLPKSHPSLLVLGEDPRLFEFRGRHYFSMQRVTEEVGHRYSETSAEQVFRNFLVDAETGRTVLLKKPEMGEPYVCSFAPDGKNWTPFVHKDELYFIYTMLPFTLLKCDVLSGDCSWIPTPQSENHGDQVGALRGGSYARVFNDRSLVGFGHATLSSAQHSPFLFVLDLVTFKMQLSFMDSGMRSTPFSGFSYMDPTSFWQEEEEVEVADAKNGDTRKISVRTFVMCTLRASPDYLSFDQSHHQTIIFEAQSSLLTALL